MYAEFKKLGYKSMDDFKAKEWNKQLEIILNDEQKYENVKDLVNCIFSFSFI